MPVCVCVCLVCMHVCIYVRVYTLSLVSIVERHASSNHIETYEETRTKFKQDKTNKYKNNMTMVIKDIMATRGWTGETYRLVTTIDTSQSCLVSVYESWSRARLLLDLALRQPNLSLVPVISLRVSIVLLPTLKQSNQRRL